jgi:hypothetical protein
MYTYYIGQERKERLMIIGEMWVYCVNIHEKIKCTIIGTVGYTTSTMDKTGSSGL